MIEGAHGCFQAFLVLHLVYWFKQMVQGSGQFGQGSLGWIANSASIKLPDWHNKLRLIAEPARGVAEVREVHMVDVVPVKPQEQVRGRPFPKGLAPFGFYNFKRNCRCRLAAGAAGRRLSNNHKFQDPQAGIRRTLQAGVEKLVTPAKECPGTRRPVGEPFQCA
jgi:hypothetical protein